MNQEPTDVVEKLQGMFQKFVEYSSQLKSMASPENTEVHFQGFSFDMKQAGKRFSVEMNIDVTLVPK